MQMRALAFGVTNWTRVEWAKHQGAFRPLDGRLQVKPGIGYEVGAHRFSMASNATLFGVD